MRKHYTYYYFDEKNDDFANTNVTNHKVPNDYIYNHSSFAYKFLKAIVYYFVLIFSFLGLNVIMGVKYKNKKVLKNCRDKSKGYFIYGNHTSYFPDAVSGPLTSAPKQCYVLINPDAINIPIIKKIIPMLGGIPIPDTFDQYREFFKQIKDVYNRGLPIVIYPEAHIWPYYNKIRDFDSVSFTYPVKLNAPCFTLTKVYKKKRNGNVRITCIYDGPFYPDTSLSFEESKTDLCQRIKHQMMKRCNEEGSELKSNIEYIQVSSPEEVRTVVSK